MDGIYEEISRLDLLDPVASAELGQDVVYAVQTGRDPVDAAECDCLDAEGIDGYVAAPVTLSEVGWFVGIGTPLVVLLVVLFVVQIVRWVA